MKNNISRIFTTALLFLSAGCNIQYSPNSTKVPEEDINVSIQSLAQLKAKSNPFFTPFSISIISDTHRYYSELDSTIEHINHIPDSEFVIVAGDLTQQGLLQEFLWTKERLDLLSSPYLTVIGNHDALENGSKIYQTIFSPLNYSFEFNNVSFIFLDTSSQESENMLAPDFGWLENELSNSGGSQYIVVVTHFPIDDSQFSAHQKEQFRLLMENYGVEIVLNGHQHQHSYTPDYAGGNVDLLTIGSVSERSYVKLHFNTSEIVKEQIRF